jgi:hypothetical protein
MAVSNDVEAACGYNMPHYREILRRARARYWLPKVHEVAFGLPERDFFLIRHDVDISADAALAMAELEHEEGVETTYYFRLHAPYYNLMEPRVVAIVQAIADMGHEVGLHYEPGFFLERGLDPVAGIRRDIETLEHLIGARTRTISQHLPAQGPVLGEICPDHPCAYQEALVHDVAYFGDSGFHWREGCVCTKIDRHRQIHTLIHPHSWVIGNRPWQDVLRAHAAELGGRIAAEMEGYIVSVEEYLENRARLDVARVAAYGRDSEAPGGSEEPG